MAENRKVGAQLNLFFFWLILFLFMNFSFAWYSPGWTDSIGEQLIGDTKKAADKSLDPEVIAKKIKAVNAKRTVKYLHFGNIEIRSSMTKIKSRHLKYLCDRKPGTVLDWPKSSKGDCIVLKYKQSFKCNGISLRIEAEKKLTAILQTSTDGIVFSTVKTLTKGANDVPLKGENIKALRIMVYDNSAAWELGDINCR